MPMIPRAVSRLAPILAVCVVLGACAPSTPTWPVAEDVLHELGYRWPPGQLHRVGMCSLGSSDPQAISSGAVVYRTTATPDEVSRFYDGIGRRADVRDVYERIQHSISTNDELLGLDAPSAAWWLADTKAVIATPLDEGSRLVAIFGGVEADLTCDDAFRSPDDPGANA